MAMQLKVEEAGGVAVVTLDGTHLDAGTTADFKKQMEPLLAAHSKMAVDLTGVQFVDSSGLGALLSCLRQLNQQGGDLKVFGMSRPVRALFEMVRMHRVFELFNDRDEALRAFGA